MADTATHAAEHLELLAYELASYDKLSTKIIRRSSGPPYLRVVSTEAGDLAETITCEARNTTGAGVYMWSWGQEIVGATLADKARSIAYVLQAVTSRM